MVAEKFDATESYSLLQMGAKGLLSYGEAREQLPRALPLVAAGGFWVPRSVLSGFVDSVLAGSHSRRLKVDTAADLSRREQEVLNSLLENLANKEIGNKLNISERTVKFHVSNLLNKFGVRRRADLILLCYQKRSVTTLEICIRRTDVPAFVIGNWAQGRGERVLRRLENCYSRLVDDRQWKIDRSGKRHRCLPIAGRNTSRARNSASELLGVDTWDCRWDCGLPKPGIA